MQTNVSPPAITRPFSIGHIGGNRLMIGVAAFAVIAAAAWQWSWLVAIGIAPLLLSVAPCAAMCGLGLCMQRMGGRACNTAPSDGKPERETLQNPSATQEI